MSYSIVDGAVYRHYKGNDYLVLGIGIHTESSERFVCYRRLDNPELIWIRPITMFFELVNTGEELQPRFKLLDCT